MVRMVLFRLRKNFCEPQQRQVIICGGRHILRLGETYELAGDWGQAIEAFSMAIELLPGNIECRIDLARAYQETGQLDDALREYQSLLETYPDNEELRARYNDLWMQLHK